MNQHHIHMLQAIEDVRRLCEEACEAALNDDADALWESLEDLESQASWARKESMLLAHDIKVSQANKK